MMQATVAVHTHACKIHQDLIIVIVILGYIEIIFQRNTQNERQLRIFMGEKDKFSALTVTVEALMWTKSFINAKPDGLNTSVT